MYKVCGIKKVYVISRDTGNNEISQQYRVKKKVDYITINIYILVIKLISQPTIYTVYPLNIELLNKTAEF